MNFKITGSSHGAEGIHTSITGIPEGVAIDLDRINSDLSRRRPGQLLTTPRAESDKIAEVTGLQNGQTSGGALEFWVANTDQRSGDYSKLAGVLRPGHGVTQDLLDNSQADVRGGGTSSARLTIGHVIAGSVARQVLEVQMPNLSIVAGLSRLAGVALAKDIDISTFTSEAVASSPVNCPDPAVSRQFEEAIRAAGVAGESLGAEVTVVARGFDAGLGGRIESPLDGILAGLIMGVHAVKSVEIGRRDIDEAIGSEVVDHIAGLNGRQVVTENNLAGGILGGRSTGEDIVVRAGFKPTSTQAAAPMRSVNLKGEPVTIDMSANRGRHDPCVAVRGAVVLEAVVAIGLLQAVLGDRGWP